MNRASILGDGSDNFSLPQGVFQNPGSGNIKPGLKPVNQNRQNQYNPTPLPTQNRPQNFSNPNIGHQQGFNRQHPQQGNNNNNRITRAPQFHPSQQQKPNLPLADGRYTNLKNSNYNNFYNQRQPQLLQHKDSPLLTREINPALGRLANAHTTPKDTKPSQYELEHQQLIAESNAHIAREGHYTNLLFTGIIGLFLYFVGTFIIIFTSNVGGQTIVNLPTYQLSWELLFSNPSRLISNVFLTIFGYFFQYARLFGFFPELGSLTVNPVPRYLMPVDILIKLSTILYFNFRWMPWDTKRTYEYGCFNSKYPYLTDEQKVTTKKEENQESGLKSINIPAVELEKMTQNSHITSPIPAQTIKNQENTKYDDEDDEDDPGILPFSGVQKPIEEWYYENETKIYSFIRTQILPGSNMVLALYFSTLRVLDLYQPAFILFYVLGIMSMFWCMQTFLLILDHNQYPPDDE